MTLGRVKDTASVRLRANRRGFVLDGSGESMVVSSGFMVNSLLSPCRGPENLRKRLDTRIALRNLRMSRRGDAQLMSLNDVKALALPGRAASRASSSGFHPTEFYPSCPVGESTACTGGQRGQGARRIEFAGGPRLWSQPCPPVVLLCAGCTGRQSSRTAHRSCYADSPASA